ncbi:unnamed protein product, partial [Gulo gulo]
MRPSVPERSTPREPFLLRLGWFRAARESHQPSGHHFSVPWGPPPEETPILARTHPWLPEAPQARPVASVLPGHELRRRGARAAVLELCLTA